MDIQLPTFWFKDNLRLVVLLLCFVVAYYAFGSRRSKLGDFPVIGNQDSADFRTALEEGCRKVRIFHFTTLQWRIQILTFFSEQYPGSAFILPTPIRPTVILPANLVEEVIREPEDVLATREEVDDRFLVKYTLMTADDHMIRRSVNLITRNINEIMDDITDELDLAISKVFGADTSMFTLSFLNLK